MNLNKGHLIILQARCSSKRLPGKVLMKINGIPLVVLIAKRLTNRGSKIIVATSSHKSDDKLIKVLKKNHLNYFRGSLKNVLSRYQMIAKKLKNNDYIIRATADNVFPDGLLVSKILNHFKKIKKNYWRIDKKKHNFPKGLSIEIFTKNKILKLKKNLNKSDKEHVTKAIYKNNINYYQSFCKDLKLRRNYYNMNLSIDVKENFNFIKKIFKGVANPIEITYKELLRKV